MSVPHRGLRTDCTIFLLLVGPTAVFAACVCLVPLVLSLGGLVTFLCCVRIVLLVWVFVLSSLALSVQPSLLRLHLVL